MADPSTDDLIIDDDDTDFEGAEEWSKTAALEEDLMLMQKKLSKMQNDLHIAEEKNRQHQKTIDSLHDLIGDFFQANDAMERALVEVQRQRESVRQCNIAATRIVGDMVVKEEEGDWEADLDAHLMADHPLTRITTVAQIKARYAGRLDQISSLESSWGRDTVIETEQQETQKALENDTRDPLAYIDVLAPLIWMYQEDFEWDSNEVEEGRIGIALYKITEDLINHLMETSTATATMDWDEEDDVPF